MNIQNDYDVDAASLSSVLCFLSQRPGDVVRLGFRPNFAEMMRKLTQHCIRYRFFAAETLRTSKLHNIDEHNRMKPKFPFLTMRLDTLPGIAILYHDGTMLCISSLGFEDSYASVSHYVATLTRIGYKLDISRFSYVYPIKYNIEVSLESFITAGLGWGAHFRYCGPDEVETLAAVSYLPDIGVYVRIMSNGQLIILAESNSDFCKALDLIIKQIVAHRVFGSGIFLSVENLTALEQVKMSCNNPITTQTDAAVRPLVSCGFFDGVLTDVLQLGFRPNLAELSQILTAHQIQHDRCDLNTGWPLKVQKSLPYPIKNPTLLQKQHCNFLFIGIRRSSPTYAVLFSDGTIICNSRQGFYNACIAIQLYTNVLSKLGYRISPRSFKCTNRIQYPFEICLEGLIADGLGWAGHVRHCKEPTLSFVVFYFQPLGAVVRVFSDGTLMTLADYPDVFGNVLNLVYPQVLRHRVFGTGIFVTVKK